MTRRPPLHRYLQRCPGGAASLQPQPQQVHPQQPRHEVMGGVAQPRPHGLVTDNYSFLICKLSIILLINCHGHCRFNVPSEQ